MSQDNVDLLRRGFEHVARTGELLRETVRPDFVWDTTTFSSVVGLNLKKCVGVDEADRWLAQWAKYGGPEVEMRFAQVWTFRDGLVARMEMYYDRAEALEAAGLRE